MAQDAGSRGALSNYKLQSVLGSGAFGEVRAALDRRTGKRVAVKSIERSMASDVSEVDRVAREFFILTSLSHRNVIRFIEVFLDEAKLYLVMEFARASGARRGRARACARSKPHLTRTRRTPHPPSSPQPAGRSRTRSSRCPAGA